MSELVTQHMAQMQELTSEFLKVISEPPINPFFDVPMWEAEEIREASKLAMDLRAIYLRNPNLREEILEFVERLTNGETPEAETET